MSIMKYFLKTCVILTLFTISFHASATTWDEPWQDKIIKEAESFVFAKVLSNDEDKGVEIEITKSLAGKSVEGKIKITSFYLLDLCSSSGGHGPEFHFEGVKECYFFLKKVKGEYAISTPTSGFAYIDDGNVYATFRHSYHQTLVKPADYELLMTAIFNYYHGKKYDDVKIKSFIARYINLEPAGFEEDEIETFCNQHAALETIYHLNLKDYCNEPVPFLDDTSNIHNQISAARALGNCATNEIKNKLFEYIDNESTEKFVIVMCIWTLKSFDLTEDKQKLEELTEKASDEYLSFGGNIMDPRVCTSIPSPKSALQKLLNP